MSVFYAVLPFIGMLVVLIVIHELGHFFTAKAFGIKVLEAGLGYPPRAWGVEWRGTIYSVNWLPLGGFVRLLGEEDPSDPQSLAAQPAWKRLIVLFAGSGMNIILPVLLFAIAFMIPRDVPIGLAQVGAVMPGSPAAEAGLQPGDTIVELDGREVRNTADAGRIIRLKQGETIDFKIKRNDPTEGTVILNVPVYARWDAPSLKQVVQPGEDVDAVADKLGVSPDLVRGAAEIEVVPEEGQEITVVTSSGPITYRVRRGDTVEAIARRLKVAPEAVRTAARLPDPNYLEPGKEIEIGQGPTGIQIRSLYAYTEKESFAPWTALGKGVNSTWEALILARNQVISLFHGGSGPDVAGPVGIAQATGQVVEQSGWQTLLDFAALLSINLAIINVLPLPMLDGGRIAFVILEVIRGGRRIAPEKEAIVHLVGLALILTMAVVVTYFDILRIIGGGSLFE
jgi:regulator of sigma E protease